MCLLVHYTYTCAHPPETVFKPCQLRFQLLQALFSSDVNAHMLDPPHRLLCHRPGIILASIFPKKSVHGQKEKRCSPQMRILMGQSVHVFGLST